MCMIYISHSVGWRETSQWVPGLLSPANILAAGTSSSEPGAPGSSFLTRSSCYLGFDPLAQGGRLGVFKMEHTQGPKDVVRAQGAVFHSFLE